MKIQFTFRILDKDSKELLRTELKREANAFIEDRKVMRASETSHVNRHAKRIDFDIMIWVY